MEIEIVEYFVNCHFPFSRSHDLDMWLLSKKGSISISMLVTCFVTFFLNPISCTWGCRTQDWLLLLHALCVNLSPWKHLHCHLFISIISYLYFYFYFEVLTFELLSHDVSCDMLGTGVSKASYLFAFYCHSINPNNNSTCQGPSHGGSYMDKGMSHIRIGLPPHIVSRDRLAFVSCFSDCLSFTCAWFDDLGDTGLY